MQILRDNGAMMDAWRKVKGKNNGNGQLNINSPDRLVQKGIYEMWRCMEG